MEPTMTNRHRLTLAIGALVASLLVGAPSALAATRLLPADIDALPRGGALEYGTTTLRLSAGASGKLRSAGVKLAGTGSADVKGSTIEFQDAPAGSIFDPTRMFGTIVAEGGLTAKGKKGTAKLTQVTFEPGTERRVTAKLAGKLIQLGKLTGGKTSFTGQADGKLSKAKVTLSAKAASKLNAITGGGFGAGSLGALSIDATARELPMASGTATMTFDPAFLKLLADNGFSITATPPATATPTSVTIPLTAGAFDPENLSGRLSLEGQISIGRPGLSVALFGWRAVVAPKQKELYASINSGVAAAIANVDVSTMVSTFNDAGQFVATGAKISLTKIAVGTLHQQFNLTVPVGTSLGTVDLVGMLSGKQ